MTGPSQGSLPFPRVAVIGSGLSALGAIQALRERGLKPVVLDWGESLEEERAKRVERMAAQPPGEWSRPDREWLTSGSSRKEGTSVPQKLAFGSGYFYGGTRKEAPVEAKGILPPFSYALGGLSCGWGAAVLPAQACDLSDWPVGAEELRDYCRKVLKDLPYSAAEDGLSLDFPLLSDRPGSLRLSRASAFLLEALDKASVLKKDQVVFGRPRLLVSSTDDGGRVPCRYCGQCMSGCVYGCIFKAGDEIRSLQAKGVIEYVPGCLVERLEEAGGKVTVEFFDREGKRGLREFDRVFLAAGAVNSTRIVLSSRGLYGKKVRLKTRGGFLLPVLSLKKLPSDWPDCNTGPGPFLELKGKGLRHWVHIQISPDNELFRRFLGAGDGPRGWMGRLRGWLAEHLFLMFVNYHSDHSGVYELWTERASGEGEADLLRSRHRPSLPPWGVLGATCLRLLGLMVRIGCLPLFPFARLNSGSYHVGGSLPMREHPAGELETDLLGRVRPWERVHVVDSSLFPSLPGTTIGLLLMANAYRIVDRIDRDGSLGGKL